MADRLSTLRLACLALASVATSASASSPISPTADWPYYINVLHHYHVCYPVRLLRPQGETDNSAGQAFKAADGALLEVYAYYDEGGSTLSQILLSDAAFSAGSHGKTNYRVIRRDWAIASGENGRGQIFYIKLFKRDDRIIKAEFHYPQDKFNRYRPVVERISKCFGLSHDIDP